MQNIEPFSDSILDPGVMEWTKNIDYLKFLAYQFDQLFYVYSYVLFYNLVHTSMLIIPLRSVSLFYVLD